MTDRETRPFLPLPRVTGLALIGLCSCAAVALAQAPPRMFRGGPSQRGVTDTPGLDGWGALTWRFRTDGSVRSSPTVVEGTVYVGSTDGRLYAVDGASGDERWRYDAGAAIGGAPLVTASHVVVIDRANRIHAVRRGTGELVWQVEGGDDLPLTWGWEGWDYFLASPMLVDDVVLAGTGDGRLYALAAETGATRWTFQTGGRIRSAPTIDDGVAYVGSGDGIVYGIRLADGTETFRFETAGHDLHAEEWGFDRTQIYSSPTVSDGVLYMGSRDASLYAVDLASGDVRWTFEDGTSWVMSSAAAIADTLIVSARSSSGRIRAIGAKDGSELWSVATGGYVFASPIVVGTTVYVGSGSGALHALDLATGEERWAYQTEGGIFSTPAIWDGHLYVGSDDGYLYAFAAGDGPRPHTAVFWDEALRGRAVWGRSDASKRVADYFGERGYTILDSGAVEAFLQERVRDRVPSVLVVAMDALPTTIAAPEETSVLRQYLDAGGKVVWMGFPPLAVVRDDAGAFQGIDRARPARLLGVDHDAFNTDEYGVRTTDTGREWGLASPGVGMPLIARAEGVVALEMTESGHASAWVKRYGGGPGTGFVHVRIGTDDGYLAELRRVAEYGVLWKPQSTAP